MATETPSIILASDFLKALGAPDNGAMRGAVLAWMRAESGSSIRGGNPWNISYPAALNVAAAGGPKPISYWTASSGQRFAIYASARDGARAAATLLTSAGSDWRGYDRVVTAARRDDPIGFLNALAKSAWDAGRYGTLNGGTNKLLELYGSATGPLAAIVKSIFGSAFTISRGFSSTHDGMDLAAPKGTPVRAVADGVVSFAAFANDGNCKANWACGGGNVVNIDLGNAKTTQYAHLDTIKVSNGARVVKGQIIGTVGATGKATGPHLHFGVWDRAANRMIDPYDVLTSTQTLGGWDNIVSFPVGHVLTESDIKSIIDKLRAAGYFNAVGGGFAELDAYDVLKQFIGKPWNKQTQDEMQAAFMQKATDADALGSIAGSVAGIAGALLDPGHWVRFLGLLVGGALVAYGGVIILRAAGAPVPSMPSVEPGIVTRPVGAPE